MDALERTLPPTRRTLGDVDPAQPLDLTHPLLDGLQRFWLPLPHLVGGSRLYDLSAYEQHGGLIDADFNVRNEGVGISTGSSDPAVNFGVQEWMTGQNPRTNFLYFFIPDVTKKRVLLTVKSSNKGEKWKILQRGVNQNDTGLALDISFQIRSTTDIQFSSGIYTAAISFPGGPNLEDARFFINGTEATSFNGGGGENLDTASNALTHVSSTPFTIANVGYNRALSNTEISALHHQARRGFPDLLNRRSDVGLLGGGGTSPISGTFALTDSQEQISATGQTEVSGTLSVTDGSETLTINGATKVSGTASITEAAEQISGAGSVITTGSVSITDAGEIISAVSSLQDITGSAQITDAGEQVDATGEVKIAGTATLNDGTEEVVIIGQNDVTGSLSFADLAAEIAATGSVEVQGSLALADAGESITARERVPARLATVDVRLEDIIIVNAKLTD